MENASKVYRDFNAISNAWRVFTTRFMLYAICSAKEYTYVMTLYRAVSDPKLLHMHRNKKG